MTERLKGKVVIVTGGGGGIGGATVELCCEEGARVAVVDADREAAETIASGLGQSALPVAADLRLEEDCERAVAQTVSAFGAIDCLANVAGVRVWGPIPAATRESWSSILEGNLLSAAYCSKFAVPKMAEHGGGSIVNVSSANAIVGRKGMAQYDASKSAMLALTRAMACDHAEQGIRVNAVCPGPTLTMYHARRRAQSKGISIEEAEAELRQAGAPATLLQRQASPREIAYAILFLLCDESSYVTGATFMIDGGLSV